MSSATSHTARHHTTPVTPHTPQHHTPAPHTFRPPSHLQRSVASGQQRQQRPRHAAAHCQPAHGRRGERHHGKSQHLSRARIELFGCMNGGVVGDGRCVLLAG
jgi:hypothetical protein